MTLSVTFRNKKYEGWFPFVVGTLSLVIYMSILPATSIAITEHYNHLTCDDALIPLVTWLRVYCAALFILVSLLLINAILIGIIYAAEGNVCCVGVYGTFNVLLTAPFLLLYNTAVFVWSVLGAITLFSNDLNCLDEAKPLWILTMVNIGLIWIYNLKYLYKKIKGEE